MRKILLCGMKYDSNFGDPIINKCCRGIEEQILQNNNMQKYEIKEIDLSGKKSFKEMNFIEKNFKYYLNKIIRKIIKINKKIFKYCKLSNIYNWLDFNEYYFSLEYMILKKYYISEIESSNIIIFVGGGFIKYKYQNCYHYMQKTIIYQYV